MFSRKTKKNIDILVLIERSISNGQVYISFICRSIHILFGSDMCLRDTQKTRTTAKNSGISFGNWLRLHGSGVFLLIFVASGTCPTQQFPLATAVLLEGLTQTFLTLPVAVLFHCSGRHPGQIPWLSEAWLTCGCFFPHSPAGELA